MADLDQLVQILLETATCSDDPAELVTAACEGLAGQGLPLWRFSLGMRTIDPTIRALSFVWRRGQSVTGLTTPYQPGPDDDLPYRRSPIYYMDSRNLTDARWRLKVGEGCAEIPLLAELRDEGATGYAMRLVRFGGETAAAMPGVAVAIATDQPGGFTDHDLGTFAAVMPALGLASYRYGLARLTSEILGVYLGPRTARRVLAGEAQRGTGRAIEAAILLADLRGFTSLASRDDPFDVVTWLDRYLEAIGEPVAAQGGEVLKFLGDGLLAVFSVDEQGAAQACAQALAASEQILAATAALNRGRRASDEPALELDVVLHFGQVVYGNVGAARRLDYTIIGRAVNEASRMEALCAELGHPLLLSAPFAARCSRATMRLGQFHLRGCEGEAEVYALRPHG